MNKNMPVFLLLVRCVCLFILNAFVFVSDVFIGVAAVADYRPQQVEVEKIKKSDDQLQLNLIRNPDIISEVAKLNVRHLVVGFAAETSNVVENGKEKLIKKNLDLIFANNATETFNNDTVSATAITKDTQIELAAGNKNVIARNMLQLISNQLDKNT